MRKKSWLGVSVVLFLVIAVSSGQAETLVWNVDADGAWSVPGNWDLNLAPVSGDTVTLSGITEDRTVTLDVAANVAVLNMGAKTVDHSFTLSGTNTLSTNCIYGYGTNADAGTGIVGTNHQVNVPWTLPKNSYANAHAGILTVNGEISGNYSLTMGNAGTVQMLGDNTYDGKTAIRNGTVVINTLGSIYGGPSSLGSPTDASTGIIELGYSATTGTLKYVGTGDTSDRTIRLASTSTGGGVIDASGTGPLVLNGAFTYNTTSLKYLTLKGTNTDLNRIDFPIGGGLTVALSKEGPGTWVLSGNNTCVGAPVIISEGTLLVHNTSGSAFGTQSVRVYAGATLGGDGFIDPYGSWSVTIDTDGILSPGINGIGVLTVDVAGGSNLVNINGILQVDVASDGSSDMLSMPGDGVLSLGAESKLVITNPTQLDTSRTYTIASYAGTRTGTFRSHNLPAGWTIDHGAHSNGVITLVYTGHINKVNQFPLGWYDSTYYLSTPEKVACEGGNIILAYDWPNDPTQLQQYLDAARAVGIKVIARVPVVYVENEDASSIREFIETYDSDPVVYGWYTADEPTLNDLSVNTCTVAYTAVKERSTKPVFIAFARSEVNNGYPISFKDSFDIMLVDIYPSKLEHPEFSDFSEFKTTVELAETQSQTINKPWWFIPQAFGDTPSDTWSWRLPTFNESKFMTYWGILNGAKGLLYWCHFKAEQSLAYPAEPYPYSGLDWISEVWMPLAQEIIVAGNALVNGPISGGISDDMADIECQAFYDSKDVKTYYLIALNKNTGTENPTFSLNLPNEILSIVPVGENRPALTVQNDSFTDTFSDYAVHVYEVLMINIPGDATGDDKVDVSDLGVLAANYGRNLQSESVAESLWWSLGDFTGDGNVDVSDLGILAAHYGEGTSGANWDADYAKAFGTTIADDNSDTVADSSVCSALGLPLIAGLILMGLMLMKLEE